jgi:hypothetical protein
MFTPKQTGLVLLAVIGILFALLEVRAGFGPRCVPHDDSSSGGFAATISPETWLLVKGLVTLGVALSLGVGWALRRRKIDAIALLVCYGLWTVIWCVAGLTESAGWHICSESMNSLLGWSFALTLPFGGVSCGSQWLLSVRRA